MFHTSNQGALQQKGSMSEPQLVTNGYFVCINCFITCFVIKAHLIDVTISAKNQNTQKPKISQVQNTSFFLNDNSSKNFMKGPQTDALGDY